ncbi:MAG: thiamine pyrophosphate-binding protein, partial [Ginsengibacter sp.]
TMSQTVGDFLINRLSEWGITRIFGFPGDGINGLMGSMDRAKDTMDFVQVRHEECSLHGLRPCKVLPVKSVCVWRHQGPALFIY